MTITAWLLVVHMTIGLGLRFFYILRFAQSRSFLKVKKWELTSILVTLGMFITFSLTSVYILKPEILNKGQLAFYPLLYAVGFILLILHLVLLFLSHQALGEMWSGYIAVKKGHYRVSSGIYKYLKHPMYMGVFCWITGLILVVQNLFFLLGLLACLALIIRIPREEALLEAHLIDKEVEP